MSATADLMALLKRHYINPSAPMPGGVFLPEVGQNGGWGSGSRCDAIYVGFTSASGRLLVGHEVKVSRSDWLTELSKPGKADAWADQCHEWWLVVSDPTIVHEGELPAGWGLMLPGKSKTRMSVHTRADRKSPADHRPSWDAVRSIMARTDTLHAEAVNRARSDAGYKANAEVEARVDQRLQEKLGRAANNDEQVRLWQDRMRHVEKALGHQLVWDEQRPSSFINQTSPAEIAEVRAVLSETRSVKAAVRQLCGVGHEYRIDSLQRAIDTMRTALAGLAEAAAPETPVPVPTPAPLPAPPEAPAVRVQPDLFSEVLNA